MFLYEIFVGYRSDGRCTSITMASCLPLAFLLFICLAGVADSQQVLLSHCKFRRPPRKNAIESATTLEQALAVIVATSAHAVLQGTLKTRPITLAFQRSTLQTTCVGRHRRRISPDAYQSSADVILLHRHLLDIATTTHRLVRQQRKTQTQQNCGGSSIEKPPSNMSINSGVAASSCSIISCSCCNSGIISSRSNQQTRASSCPWFCPRNHQKRRNNLSTMMKMIPTATKPKVNQRPPRNKGDHA
jgi:hypothetical protein